MIWSFFNHFTLKEGNKAAKTKGYWVWKKILNISTFGNSFKISWATNKKINLKFSNTGVFKCILIRYFLTQSDNPRWV